VITMATDFVRALQEELSSVATRLQETQAKEEAIRAEMGERLRALAEERTTLEARLRHLQALLTLEGQPQHTSAPLPTVVAASSAERSLADDVYGFLSEAARDYHYLDLTTALMARGVEIPGKDPAKNLVAHIHSDPRFVRPKRGVYALAEWYPKGTKSVGVRKRKRGRAPGKTTKSSRRRVAV
jgi:hypothetical protein